MTEPRRSFIAQLRYPLSSSDEQGDIVHLSPSLWRELESTKPIIEFDGPSDVLPVAITIRDKQNERNIIAFAVSMPTSEEEMCIYLPQSLVRANSIKYITSACISLSNPIPLTTAIVDLDDRDIYDYVCAHKEQFRNELQKHILRSSESQAVSLEQRLISFKTLYTNPVLQGWTIASTELIFTCFDKEISNGHGHSSYRKISDGTQMEEELKMVVMEEEEESESFAEINEDFMASSLLGDHVDTNGLHFALSPAKTLTGEITEDEQSEQVNIYLTAFPLTCAIDVSELHPKPSKRDDPESFVYLHLTDFVKLGCFSGDFVEISANSSNRRRLHRAFASDALQPGMILMAPTLLFNVNREAKSPPLQISVSQSRSKTSPMIAKTVTVARVASPITIDRTYQPAFLAALRNYFENVERIVASGDIISVGMNESAATLLPKRQEGEVDIVDDINLPFTVNQLDLVAYFQITKIECALESGNSRYETFRVDTKKTKMMQSGIGHSLVPSVKRYLGISSDTVICPRSESSLVSEKSAYYRLSQLVGVALYGPAKQLGFVCTIILEGPRGSGKRTIAEWTADNLNLHLLEVNCFELVGESDVKTEGSLRAMFDKAVNCAPCILLLRHADALARKSSVVESGQDPSIAKAIKDCIRQLQDSYKSSGFPVIVIATTSDVDKIPTAVIANFKHEVVIESPIEEERLDILKALTKEVKLAPDVSLKTLATQTAALVARDLVSLISHAGVAALERVRESIKDENIVSLDIGKAGVALTGDDFEKALNDARSSYSDSIGAPKIPNVTWDDVGGLASVKSDILDTIQLPLEHPELFASGMKKRSGILLYGPPGTGKTLLAKAVATSCSLNFFSVKGPELLNMYIGESEANVRRVFQRARDAKPCVIFFDELDSVAPKRGNQGDSGGVMDRIVSQLLAELDGMSEGKGSGDVFVIGATNRPDLLDPALLRPGRFDKMLYLGVSDTHETQLAIIQALTRKFCLEASLDLSEIAGMCPFNYTGADFYALCSDAMLKAMSRKAESMEKKVQKLNSKGRNISVQTYLDQYVTEEELNVEVGKQDFESALRELVPSVSEKELEHYKKVQERFKDQALNADKDKKRGLSLNKAKTKVNGEAHGNSNGMSNYDGKGKGKAPIR